MNRSSRVLRGLAGAAALALTAGTILAYVYFPRVSDGKPTIWTKHWTTLYASPTDLAPENYKGSMFRKAAKSWSTTPGTDFRYVVVDGFHDPILGDLDGANDAYFAPLGYYILGVCYVYDNSGKFVLDPERTGADLWDCDVAFNQYLVIWDTGYFDFQSTALHELGHALGLGHTTDATAVMFPYAYPYEMNRVPQLDDVEGQDFLYPPPPGGGRGFPTDPPPVLPTRFGVMTDLVASRTEALVGDPISFEARVFNGTGDKLLFSGVQTDPATSGEWDDTQMEAGEERRFSLSRTVTGLPGDYETRLRLGGADQTAVYLAQQTLLGDRLRVRREPIPLEVQDQLSASLGPAGTDTIRLFLPKGAKFVLEPGGASAWGGGLTAILLDAAGLPVPGWAPGKVATARATGDHRLLVTNPTRVPGGYGVITTGRRNPPRIRAPGALDGAAPAEVSFPALGRSGGVLEVKAPKRLGARITALRSPSGVELPLVEGASVAVDEFGEGGTWTAVVEGLPGEAGRFTLRARPGWVLGEATSF